MSWHRFFSPQARGRGVDGRDGKLHGGGNRRKRRARHSGGRGTAAGGIKFGNPGAVRETLWQQNTVTIIDNLWRDLKYATRTLTRTPGFATIAILVMALGIGANVALFTVVRSVLLNPLPSRLPTNSSLCMQRPIRARAVVWQRAISMIGKANPTASNKWPSGDGQLQYGRRPQ